MYITFIIRYLENKEEEKNSKFYHLNTMDDNILVYFLLGC